MIARLAIATFVITAGCRNDSPPAQAQQSAEPPRVARTFDASPAPEDAPSPPPPHDTRPDVAILIRDTSIGPITAKTRLKDLETVFPDLDRDGEMRWSPEFGRKVMHTWFSRRGQPVLMVLTEPKQVGSPVIYVSISDPSVATAEGARTGLTIAELARIYPDLSCTFGARDPTPALHLNWIECVTRKLPHVRFSPAVDRERPPGPIELDSIAELIVNTITWRP